MRRSRRPLPSLPSGPSPLARRVPSGPSGPLGRGRRAKRPRRRRTFVVVLIAAAIAVVAGIAAVIVVVVAPGSHPNATGFVPTGSSPGQDAGQITTAFLAAWQTGDLGQAARYTDHPAAAQAALAAYSKDLAPEEADGHHPERLRGTPSGTSSTPRESVTFAVNATVSASYGTKTLIGTWKYTASLDRLPAARTHRCGTSPGPPMSSRPTSPRPLTWRRSRWRPRSPRSTTPAATSSTSYGDAGLTTIANLLQRTAPPGQGAPGLYVEIQTAKNQLVPNSQAVVTPPNNIPALNTTITHAGGERRAVRRRRPQEQLDGRHPALHRQHPGHRQQ